MKITKLLTLSLLLAGLFFSSCSHTRYVTMTAMRPAQISFPSYINTFLLVDRTRYRSKGAEIIKGILSGEAPGEDKAGLQAGMATLQQTLQSSPRFQVKTASEGLIGNSLTAAFPDPIEWGTIQELCSRYQADAIIAFEIFSTDFIPTSGSRVVKKEVSGSNGEKREVESTEYYARGVADIKMGIRMYDPKAHSIVDQQLFTQARTWEATGTSVLDALGHLIAKAEATRQVSMQVAEAYAYKISPMPIRITREFYSHSKHVPELDHGARMADVNDWQGAIKTWQNAINSAPRKEAGWLCYDVAIGFEVLGDLEMAKTWAGKAWVQYGTKKARTYSRMLDDRIAESERVKEQMK